MPVLILTPTAQTIILITAMIFGFLGFAWGWARMVRLFIWTAMGAALVLLGGSAFIQRINDFYRAFILLLKSGFSIKAAFSDAAAQFSSIPPLIPPQWERLALLAIFLGFVVWGCLPRGWASVGPGDLMQGGTILDRLVRLPVTLFSRLPGSALGAVNGFIIAYTVTSLLAWTDSVQAEKTVVTVPVGQVMDLIREHWVFLAAVVIAAFLLRLAIGGTRASSGSK